MLSDKFSLREDFVEYFLFPNLTNQFDDEKLKYELDVLLKLVKDVSERYTKEYFWNKDEFNLAVRNKCFPEGNEEKDVLPPHLYGITYYGDNIQDEWFIVYLICEITKHIPGIIGRIIDADGEFLLIEAADALPKWANPDTCEQRVYIFNGHLHIVQNSPSNTSSILPVSTAIKRIWNNPKLHETSKEIQSYIDDRIDEYKGNKDHLFHYQIVKIPIAIAAILRKKPSLITSVCHAFCDRDIFDMKKCNKFKFFPLKNCIRARIKFTRFVYAMTMHNNYVPNEEIRRNLPPPATEQFKEDILGLKITCGFEILANQIHQNHDIENDQSWKTYLKSLTNKGYFKNNIEGSKDYNCLLEDAKKFYKDNLNHFKTSSSIVGEEILSYLKELKTDEELKIEKNNLLISEPDDWLNVLPEELNEMLLNRYSINKLYKPNKNSDPTEFTCNVEKFLDKESEFDGIELHSPHNTDLPCNKNKTNDSSSCDQINFDPDSFQNHVKCFLDFAIPDDDDDDDHLESSGMSDYEYENSEKYKTNKISVKTGIEKYMNQMDYELSNTTIGKTFKTVPLLNKTATNNDTFDDPEMLEPIDINVNTFRNMIDSYKSQIGGSGPITSILGSMGIGIEKYDDNNDVGS